LPNQTTHGGNAVLRTRCHFSALPAPAFWFRRLALLLVAATILMLPMRAAEAASPPLVMIQTRVVGTGSNLYSTQVGNGPLAPPTTYLATGAGPGYHVVALNRATLALVFNNTYGLDFTSLQSMNNDVTGLGNNVLVVISSIGPVTSIAAQAIPFLNNVAAYLGGTGSGFMYFGTVNQSPPAYSLIGIPGSGAPAIQVSAVADPDTDGNIAGALVLDINGNYAFTYSKFVTIQTMTGPQQDTIMIGKTAFEAPPLPFGAAGGFHLLIVKRTTLDRIATDPTVVFLNASYGTNSSDTFTAANESDRMLMDLNRFPNGLSNGELIFIISSLGAPGFNSNSFEVLIDEGKIETIIQKLGGAGGLNNLPPGFYSLIGIPNSGVPTLSPEVRSWATPVSSSGKPVLSGNITAVLQQNNVGLFTPISSSAFPNATLDLSLYSAAYAAPVPWPVAPHGSDPVCPTGAQPCAAYKWISWQMICQGNSSCTDEDARGHYTDIILSLASPSSLTYPPQPTTQPAGFRFSETAFNKVKNQLTTELAPVNDVRSFFTANVAALTDSAILDQMNLGTAYMDVQTDVQLPPSTSVSSVNVLGVIRDALMVGQIIAGGVAPELIPAFAVMNATIYLGMQFNYTPQGASKNQILSTYAKLESDTAGAFTSGLANGGVLENLLLTDWNKLQTVGTNIENAKEGSAWFINTTTVPNIASAMASAFKVSFYQALLPAAYQIVFFSNVPFSDPSSYCYLLDPSQGPSVTPYNEPPSGALTILPTSSGTDYIWLAASPPEGSGIQNFSYPTNALMSKLFCTMNLYYKDFFFTQRGWGGMALVLPEGWSYFQASGECPSPASGRSFHGHGLPGAALARRPLTPLLDPGARAPLAGANIKRLKNPYCSLSR
jgi:hypothetical protein